MGVYDLASVRDAGALFIRKVSDQIDHNMARLFPVDRLDQVPDISWPEIVAISDKPDWEEFREKMMARRAPTQSQRDGEAEEADDDEEL